MEVVSVLLRSNSSDAQAMVPMSESTFRYCYKVCLSTSSITMVDCLQCGSKGPEYWILDGTVKGPKKQATIGSAQHQVPKLFDHLAENLDDEDDEDDTMIASSGAPSLKWPILAVTNALTTREWKKSGVNLKHLTEGTRDGLRTLMWVIAAAAKSAINRTGDQSTLDGLLCLQPDDDDHAPLLVDAEKLQGMLLLNDDDVEAIDPTPKSGEAMDESENVPSPQDMVDLTQPKSGEAMDESEDVVDLTQPKNDKQLEVESGVTEAPTLLDVLWAGAERTLRALHKGVSEDHKKKLFGSDAKMRDAVQLGKLIVNADDVAVSMLFLTVLTGARSVPVPVFKIAIDDNGSEDDDNMIEDEEALRPMMPLVVDTGDNNMEDSIPVMDPADDMDESKDDSLDDADALRGMGEPEVRPGRPDRGRRNTQVPARYRTDPEPEQPTKRAKKKQGRKGKKRKDQGQKLQRKKPTREAAPEPTMERHGADDVSDYDLRMMDKAFIEMRDKRLSRRAGGGHCRAVPKDTALPNVIGRWTQEIMVFPVDDPHLRKMLADTLCELLTGEDLGRLVPLHIVNPFKQLAEDVDHVLEGDGGGWDEIARAAALKDAVLPSLGRLVVRVLSRLDPAPMAVVLLTKQLLLYLEQRLEISRCIWAHMTTGTLPHDAFYAVSVSRAFGSDQDQDATAVNPDGRTGQLDNTTKTNVVHKDTTTNDLAVPEARMEKINQVLVKHNESLLFDADDTDTDADTDAGTPKDITNTGVYNLNPTWGPVRKAPRIKTKEDRNVVTMGKTRAGEESTIRNGCRKQHIDKLIKCLRLQSFFALCIHGIVLGTHWMPTESLTDLFAVLLFAAVLPSGMIYDTACQAQRLADKRLHALLGQVALLLDDFHAITGHHCVPDFSIRNHFEKLIVNHHRGELKKPAGWLELEPTERLRVVRKRIGRSELKDSLMTTKLLNTNVAEQYNSAFGALGLNMTFMSPAMAQMHKILFMQLYNLRRIHDKK